MKLYAIVEDEKTGICQVGLGTDNEYYESIGMSLMDVEEAFDGQWYLEGYAPKPPQEFVVKTYEDAVDKHIDAVAQANDFDSILTCTKYTGFDNEFRAHAEALLAWNAQCWVVCHSIIDAVFAGEREQPTKEELIAELPAFVWNGGVA